MPLLRNAVPLILTIVGILGLAQGAIAQEPASAPVADATAATPAPQNADDDEDDSIINPAEPDYVVINMPTTARLPLRKGNFRIIHRFAGNLANMSFSDAASTLFGIDQGANIGFEYRIGVMRGLQAAVLRTNFDQTIQMYAKYDAIRQRGHPVAISAILSVEGAENFQEDYAPAVGVVVSRTVSDRAAFYFTPVWVDNTAAALNAPGTPEDERINRSTTYVGLGARLRVLTRVYLVGEVTPRLDGYNPNKPTYGFGIEKRVGHHMFSLTFTNSFAMTFAQLARGGPADALYMGFNLGRKFF